MNASVVSGHVLGSIVATVVWEIAIHLPTATPGSALVTAGIVAPPVFAAASLALIVAAGPSRRSEPTHDYLPPAQTRRAVPQRTRKELAR